MRGIRFHDDARLEFIEVVPLYAEQRQCVHPTTEQVLRLFSLTRGRTLTGSASSPVQVFDAELTDWQCQVLKLLGLTVHACRPAV